MNYASGDARKSETQTVSEIKLPCNFMKNKTFFQLHLFSKIMVMLGMSLSAFLIWWAFFSYEKDNNGFKGYVLCFIAIALILLVLFALFGNTLKFFDTYLYTRGDFADKESKTQFKLKINYNDIEMVDLGKSVGNSRKRTKSRMSYSFKYIEFTLKNGRRKWLSIQWYSKRQKIKIIDELKRRLDAVGNHIDMPDTVEMVNNLYKIQDFYG